MTDLDQKYQEAMDYLYHFVDYSLVNQKVFAAAEFNLTRVFRLAELAGHPQQAYLSIHVAGSKGKGSVSALCASALEAAGYRVGLYTSPHLSVFEERIQINRQMISRSDLIASVDALKPLVAQVPGITTFEIMTVLAFWYFAREKVDAAVIEVGLGGRLDATNIIVPTVSVITALFLEHTFILGDTLAQIAAEKGGIIKPGVPVVLSPQRDEAREVIEKIASERSAPLIQVGKDYIFRSVSSSLEKQSFCIQDQVGGAEVALQIPLLGSHQVENAASAYAALHVMRAHGVELNEQAIQEGFSAAHWPARFEILSQQPTIILDAAHTPDAAQKLRETVQELFPDRRVILVFGVSEDKNVKDMVVQLSPISEKIICTQSDHPRAMEAGALKSIIEPFNIPVWAVDQVQEALQTAREMAGPGGVVLVTGSIFVAGNARDFLTGKP